MGLKCFVITCLILVYNYCYSAIYAEGSLCITRERTIRTTYQKSISALNFLQKRIDDPILLDPILNDLPQFYLQLNRFRFNYCVRVSNELEKPTLAANAEHEKCIVEFGLGCTFLVVAGASFARGDPMGTVGGVGAAIQSFRSAKEHFDNACREYREEREHLSFRWGWV